MGCKESNQTNKKQILFPDTSYYSHDQEPICVQNCETLPPPHLLCFWQNKTAFKYIADPIINQIIQCTSIACEWSITKAYLKMSSKKKDCKYEKSTPKSLIFRRKVYFSIP